MPLVTKTFYPQSGPDDAENYGSSLTWNNNRVYVNMGTHINASYGPYTGWRFLIDETIDPDDVTDARLYLNANNSVAVEAVIRVESGNAAVWADTALDRLQARYAAAPSANQLTWSMTLSSNSWFQSPNLVNGVKVALGNIVKNQYIGIVAGNNGTLGSSKFGQIISMDHSATNRRPYMTITYNVDPQHATVDIVAPTIDIGIGDATSVAYNKQSDISYHDGIGSSVRRQLDIYTPTTPPPPGGYPTVLFIHGGGFLGGNKSDIIQSPEIMDDTLSAGMAIVSMNYKLVDGNLIFNTNTGWARPSLIQDGFAVLKWIKANASTYDLNYEKLIGISYSSGGHILLELALAANDPTRDSYELGFRGVSTTQGDRYPNFPSNIVSEGRSMEDMAQLKGIMSVSGPTSLRQASIGQPVVGYMIRLLFGLTPNDGYISTIAGEGELHDYIKGTAETIYEDKGPTKPSFSIGMMYSTIDTTVVPSAGYEPLQEALDTVDYPSVENSGDVYEGVGFSYWGEAVPGSGGGHDTIFRLYNRQFLQDWYSEMLRQLSPGPEPTIKAYIGDKEVLSFRLGEDEITGILGDE